MVLVCLQVVPPAVHERVDARGSRRVEALEAVAPQVLGDALEVALLRLLLRDQLQRGAEPTLSVERHALGGQRKVGEVKAEYRLT